MLKIKNPFISRCTIVYTTILNPKVFERKKPSLKGARRSPQFSKR
ncbi:30S ribosomal protein S9 [Macrococcoides caseolyticum]|nr:30S ribosomal protein S9 [Macrococcus caseolyticus]